MEPRQQRGLEIAARSRIRRKGNAWIVPSQSGAKAYTVCPDDDEPHCTCPDHETRGGRCKHIYAVEFVMEREENEDGSITETLTVTETIKPRPTRRTGLPTTKPR